MESDTGTGVSHDYWSSCRALKVDARREYALYSVPKAFRLLRMATARRRKVLGVSEVVVDLSVARLLAAHLAGLW
jgi:hypothetical protein